MELLAVGCWLSAHYWSGEEVTALIANVCKTSGAGRGLGDRLKERKICVVCLFVPVPSTRGNVVAVRSADCKCSNSVCTYKTHQRDRKDPVGHGKGWKLRRFPSDLLRCLEKHPPSLHENMSGALVKCRQRSNKRSAKKCTHDGKIRPFFSSPSFPQKALGDLTVSYVRRGGSAINSCSVFSLSHKRCSINSRPFW